MCNKKEKNNKITNTDFDTVSDSVIYTRLDLKSHVTYLWFCHHGVMWFLVYNEIIGQKHAPTIDCRNVICHINKIWMEFDYFLFQFVSEIEKLLLKTTFKLNFEVVSDF